MTMKILGLTALGALMALGVACSDDTDTNGNSGGSGGAGPTTTTTSSGGAGAAGGGTGGGGEACEAPEPPHEGDSAAVDGITATYIDQDGAPAQGVQTTVCGTNICSTPADSDANGEVAVDSSDLTVDIDNPRFNAGHNAQLYGKLSGPIPMLPTTDFGTVRVVRMAPFADGAAFEPGSTFSHGGVSLTLDANAMVEHEIIDYPEPSQRVLRGAVVDVRGWPESEKPQIDSSLGIEVLVVVMPLGTHMCPGAQMAFDNVNGWAADSEVDIYENGAKTFKHYAPYGGWAKVSEGVVSSDGTTVTTKDGMEIESLGTFGIAPK